MKFKTCFLCDSKNKKNYINGLFVLFAKRLEVSNFFKEKKQKLVSLKSFWGAQLACIQNSPNIKQVQGILKTR